METIKAIDTEYKGFKFRSRLEARWAIFFDMLNIEWQYEPEGYELNGIRYLPDFYLPEFNFGMYVEVKPVKLTEQEHEKAKRLCIATGKTVLLAVGLPDYAIYEYYEAYSECVAKGHEEYSASWFDDVRPEHTCVYGPKDKATLIYGLIKTDQGYDENRMYWNPQYEAADAPYEGEYHQAVKVAKQARFEFNNKNKLQ